LFYRKSQEDVKNIFRDQMRLLACESTRYPSLNFKLIELDGPGGKIWDLLMLERKDGKVVPRARLYFTRHVLMRTDIQEAAKEGPYPILDGPWIEYFIKVNLNLDPIEPPKSVRLP
jgi:hypothetical protein